MYLNRVTLIGFLGQDARTAATQTRREVSRFSLATTRRYQQDSEWKEKTQWHDCVVYGKVAAYAAKLSQGDHVLVEGELTYREYSRTVDTESGPVQVLWRMTAVIRQISLAFGSQPKGKRERTGGGRLGASFIGSSGLHGRIRLLSAGTTSVPECFRVAV